MQPLVIGDSVGNLLPGFLSVLPSVMSLTSVLTKLCRRSSTERLEKESESGRTDRFASSSCAVNLVDDDTRRPVPALFVSFGLALPARGCSCRQRLAVESVPDPFFDDPACSIIGGVDLEHLVTGLPGEYVRKRGFAETRRTREEQNLGKVDPRQPHHAPEEERNRAAHFLVRSTPRIRSLSSHAFGQRVRGKVRGASRTASSIPFGLAASRSPAPNPPFPPSRARLLRRSRFISAAALAFDVPLNTHMSHSFNQSRAERWTRCGGLGI